MGLSVPGPVAWLECPAISIEPVRPLAQESRPGPGRNSDPAWSPRGPGRGSATAERPPDRTRGRLHRDGCGESRGGGSTSPRKLRSPPRKPREGLQTVPNPGPAMVIGLVREGIDPAEESPAHDPLHTVIDPDLIRDHDLRAIPPCHAQMLHIGSRYLGPVERRPGQPHDDQTYQVRIRLSSSQRKLWVAPTWPQRGHQGIGPPAGKDTGALAAGAAGQARSPARVWVLVRSLSNMSTAESTASR